MKFVLLEQKGMTGILTIQRPEALNALNSALIAELTEALNMAASMDLRSLIISGAGGKAFAAGADIGEMKDLGPEQAEEFSARGNRLMDSIEQFPIPVIAAVNGFALGGGCELALACDIRLAADNAVFAFPEVSIGVLPGYGGIKRLVRLIGAGRAKEMIFTARRIKAAEALALGLVNSVHSASELTDSAMRTADMINANAPLAVRGAKKSANESTGLTLQESRFMESKYFGACFGTIDQHNAMTAFVEKQKPAPFTGK
jgi:enoyl-CoA hydratase